MRLLPPLLALLVLAAPARASTIASESVQGLHGTYTRVVITGTEGPDRIDVTADESSHRFHDPAGLHGEADGCTREDAATVRCPRWALRADLRGGDDVIGAAEIRDATVAGGEGDDRLAVPGAHMLGGPGADVLTGHPLHGERLDGGPGPDVLDPGGGKHWEDRLDYADRTGGVSVDVGGDAAAGEAGEHDVVKPGFDHVTTGSGPDRVTSAPEGTTVSSGAGDDVLEGGPGSDRFETGDGADTARGGGGNDGIFGDDGAVKAEDDWREGSPGFVGVASPGETGRDRLEGGPGDDYVHGSAGPDVLDGGAGRDTLVGGLGVDVMGARDGEADRVWCERWFGSAPSLRRDRATLDSLDDNGWCGVVARSGPPVAELLFAGEPRARRRRTGTVVAVVACPAVRRCRGTLAVRAGRLPDTRVAGRVRFAVPGRRRRTVRIPFRLRDQEHQRGRTTLVVRLDARDAAGRPRRAELALERRLR